MLTKMNVNLQNWCAYVQEPAARLVSTPRVCMFAAINRKRRNAADPSGYLLPCEKRPTKSTQTSNFSLKDKLPDLPLDGLPHDPEIMKKIVEKQLITKK